MMNMYICVYIYNVLLPTSPACITDRRSRGDQTAEDAIAEIKSIENLRDVTTARGWGLCERFCPTSLNPGFYENLN